MNRPNSVLIVARCAADQGAQAGEELAAWPGRAAGSAAAGPRPRPAVKRSAGSGEHVQRDHVVGGPPVAQRPRAAGVVADRAADGGAGVRGGVGPEAQPVRGGGGGDVIEHGPGFHHRRPLLRVDARSPG